MDTNVKTEEIKNLSLKEITVLVLAMGEKIASLEASVEALKPTPKGDPKEMSDEDAEKITYGEFAALKHKDAAEKLGLSYGQVYSARGEFTFKNVHKKAKEAGKKNGWVK